MASGLLVAGNQITAPAWGGTIDSYSCQGGYDAQPCLGSTTGPYGGSYPTDASVEQKDVLFVVENSIEATESPGED